MALKRLGIHLSAYLCIASLAMHLASPSTVVPQIPPDRDITPLDSPALPQWKLHWDMGREAARRNDYVSSAKYYALLLEEKPQIEEAQWEYSRVLMQLREYTAASTILEGLIDENPYRLDYLALAGKAALAAEEYNRAVRYLGQVYSQQPEGEEGVEILRGLIQALQGLDRKAQAFVLLEQLRLRTGDSPELLLEMARVARDLGYTDKAEAYYSTLLAAGGGSRETRIEAAQLFSTSGKEESAALLWRQLLEEEPKNSEYHQRLISHYRKTEEHAEALPHLLALLDDTKEVNPELLLETARIYFKDEGRADTSLRYYERYLQLRGGDAKAAAELEQARQLVAKELAVAVVKNGAERTWKELEAITDNRLPIFQRIAEKLQQQKNKQPLIGVLEILYRQPGNATEEMALQLAELHAAAGNSQAAYQYFSSLTSEKFLTYSYYQQRAALELALGYDVAAMETLLQALSKNPDRDDLRLQAIRLAGELGFVDTLDVLGNPLVPSGITPDRLELYLAYRNGLRDNGHYVRAEVWTSRLLRQAWLTSGQREHLQLEQARDLKAMGQIFTSQQQLRTLLATQEQSAAAVVAELVEHSIHAGQIEDGKALVAYYVQQAGANEWQNDYRPESRSLALASVHLLMAEGNSEGAIAALDRYVTGYRQKNSAALPEERQILLDLEVELCQLSLRAGKKQLCLDLAKSYETSGPLPPEIRLVKYIAQGKGTVNPEALIANLPGRSSGTGGARELLRLAKAAVVLEKEDAARSFLQEYLRYAPGSMRARLSIAAIAKAQGRLEDAVSLYGDLWQSYSDETWLYAEYLKLLFRTGHYERVLAELDGTEENALSVDLRLLKARTLYAVSLRPAAFTLYEKMLTPTVKSEFMERLRREELQFNWQEQAKETFWTAFRYDEPDQLDKLNAIQGNEGFLAMARTPLGVVAAQLYDSYQWEKIVSSEYSARKALEEQKYTVAEKQYRKNTDQGPSTEGLKDLVKIYERLGDYDKQAQVYSSLEKRGEMVPELQDSIERNKLARAPTLAASYHYLEKNGRDEQINLKLQQIGSGFHYLPSASSSLQIEYRELFYQPENGDSDSLHGRLFSAAGTYAFNARTSLEAGAGLQILDGDGESSAISSLRLNRQLDELLSGYLAFRQELVDDTLDAVEQGVSTSSFLGGMVLEGRTGITLGAEFERLWYDDDNSQNRMYLWSAYSIFAELTTYEFKYSYEMISNRDDDTGAGGSGGGTIAEPLLPYWSPSEYWQHMFSVKVHHLLRNLEEAEGPPSAFSIDMAVGYEADREVTFAGGGDIFLEIGSNFLVKGRLFYTESSDYREQSAALSLLYRW